MVASLGAALAVEIIKWRRSVVAWASAAALTVAGLVGGFFMFVLQDPGRARSAGLLGNKAQLSGQPADWPGYFALAAQIVAVAGLLTFGVVVIWLLGREFVDGTAKDLLALPTSRSTMVAAKLVLALGWSLLLTLHVLFLSLVCGLLLGLPGWSTEVALHGAGRLLAVGALTAVLSTGYGLVASIGRGYLGAIGALVVTLVGAQLLSALGFGQWFPWAVPALLSGAAGPEQASPGVLSIVAVLLVGIASAVGIAMWWERADHSG